MGEKARPQSTLLYSENSIDSSTVHGLRSNAGKLPEKDTAGNKEAL